MHSFADWQEKPGKTEPDIQSALIYTNYRLCHIGAIHDGPEAAPPVQWEPRPCRQEPK